MSSSTHPNGSSGSNLSGGSPAAGVRVATLSETGMRRSHNQDFVSSVLAETPGAWRHHGHLFLVADGMGAHAAGEIASRLASETVGHHYLKSNRHDPGSSIVDSFHEANREIHRRGQANLDFRNMGTTCSSLVLLPQGALIGHVGDSRVYRLRGSVLEQLTFDHSLVWELEASGELSEAVIRGGAIPKNVITRSLGPNPSVQVDLEGPFAVLPGDQFLLCSDGLSGQVSDEEISHLLQVLDVDQAARVLVDLANLRGGPDNISVIVVKVLGLPAVDEQSAPVRNSEAVGSVWWQQPLLVTSLICFLFAAILAAVSQWPLAIIASGLGLAGLLFQSLRWLAPPTEDLPQAHRSGRAPYRVCRTAPGESTLQLLLDKLEELSELKEKNRWSIDWPAIPPRSSKGRNTPEARSHAFRQAALAILSIMTQIRSRGVPASDSAIEL
ncbi:MAG: PP2C family protein-serine/threonine phosphatase [Pirellulaceae bacterium]